MIRATVHPSQEGFDRLTAQLEAKIRIGLDEAAVAAAQVAQEGASIDLELQVVHVHGTEDGYSSGIRAEKKGSRGTRIAGFFDQGTLGNRRKKPKRPGRGSWTVNREGAPYTAQRHDVAGKGIKPERFFGKARVAGRAALRSAIHRAS